MTRLTAVMIAAATLVSASQVYAQESTAGPGPVVVTVIPGGATFFTEGKDTKDRASETTISARRPRQRQRFVGVEGEVSGALGVARI
jgi:hypothetical protein